jgi:hypothetical protein
MPNITNEQLSQLFVGSNNLGAKQSFASRKFYNSKAYLNSDLSYSKAVNQENTVKLFNNKIVRPIPGTIDKFGCPLQPKRDLIISALNEDKSVYQNLDFVVRSFQNLQKAYKAAIYQGKILDQRLFLSNLKVYKGFNDPYVYLQGYIQEIVGLFISQFSKDDRNNTVRIVDFPSFIDYAFRFLTELSKTRPINYSSLILTDKIDLQSNGVMFDISDLAPSKDSDKLTKIINEPNFLFFKNTANNFGFKVVREMPSKLVLDFDSPFIYGKSCVCGVEYDNGLTLKSKEEIIDNYFEPAYYFDLSFLFSIYEAMYEQLITKIPKTTMPAISNRGNLVKTLIRRENSSLEEKAYYLNDLLLMRQYLTLKNIESNLFYNESTIQNFSINSLQIINSIGFNAAMDYINRKFAVIPAYRFYKEIDENGNEFFTSRQNNVFERLNRYDYRVE